VVDWIVARAVTKRRARARLDEHDSIVLSQLLLKCGLCFVRNDARMVLIYTRLRNGRGRNVSTFSV